MASNQMAQIGPALQHVNNELLQMGSKSSISCIERKLGTQAKALHAVHTLEKNCTEEEKHKILFLELDGLSPMTNTVTTVTQSHNTETQLLSTGGGVRNDHQLHMADLALDDNGFPVSFFPLDLEDDASYMMTLNEINDGEESSCDASQNRKTGPQISIEFDVPHSIPLATNDSIRTADNSKIDDFATCISLPHDTENICNLIPVFDPTDGAYLLDCLSVSCNSSRQSSDMDGSFRNTSCCENGRTCKNDNQENHCDDEHVDGIIEGCVIGKPTDCCKGAICSSIDSSMNAVSTESADSFPDYSILCTKDSSMLGLSRRVDESHVPLSEGMSISCSSLSSLSEFDSYEDDDDETWSIILFEIDNAKEECSPQRQRVAPHRRLPNYDYYDVYEGEDDDEEKLTDEEEDASMISAESLKRKCPSEENRDSSVGAGITRKSVPNPSKTPRENVFGIDLDPSRPLDISIIDVLPDFSTALSAFSLPLVAGGAGWGHARVTPIQPLNRRRKIVDEQEKHSSDTATSSSSSLSLYQQKPSINTSNNNPNTHNDSGSSSLLQRSTITREAINEPLDHNTTMGDVEARDINNNKSFNKPSFIPLTIGPLSSLSLLARDTYSAATILVAKAAANITTTKTLLQTQELLNKGGRVGIYLPHARKARIARFHKKRMARTWRKKVKYSSRKKLADSRPRIKGRFVKRSN